MSNRNATVTVNTKANTSGIKNAANSIKGFDAGLKGSIANLKSFKGALAGLAVVSIAKGIKSFADDMYDAFKVQWLAEKSINDALYSNMTARGASQKEIDNEVKAYKELASAQQQVGVIGDEVTLSGMGVMTQMGMTTKQVKEMTPLLQDLAVKQYGLNVSGEQYKQVSQSVATMVNMGKLTLQGYGIQVTDTERKQFKAMSQADRYSFIMNKLKNSVAGANEAMAQTTSGKIQQMNNAIGDCEEKVGQLVNTIYGGFATLALPVVENATGAFQELIDILGGVEVPDGGYKFFDSEEVEDLQLIGQHLSDIATKIGEIFDFDGGSLSDLIGTKQFISDLESITNEIQYVIDKLAALKQAWQVASKVEAGLRAGGVPSPTGNANGTNYWQGGPTIVGEYGPELVNLPRGSSVNTNAQTQRELSGSGTTVNCPITIQGNVIGNQEFIDEVGSAISGQVQLALSNM
nr:MAG TPA: tape measure protein [Caudoviricetes sp.]